MKKNAFIKKIAEAIIECMREELPRLISAKMQPPPAVREEHDGTPYLKQIVAAQQFLNANRNAHDEIDKLHEREDPQFVCIINGGQNLIAPNAQQAEQNIQDSTPEK